MSRNVTVAAFRIRPFIEFSAEREGIEERFLATLMAALRTNYRVVLAPAEFGQELPDGSWNGFAGEVMSRRADMAMACIGQNYERSLSFAFSVPYFFTNIVFATDLPRPLPTAYAFVYPFDVTTWVLLASLVALLPLLFALLFRSGEVSRVWLGMFANVLGRSVPQEVTGVPKALFMSGWWFGTLVLCYAYSSLVFSFLSVPAMDVPPRDFHRLSEAVARGEWKVFVPSNLLPSKMITSATQPHLRVIAEGVERHGWRLNSDEFGKGPFGHHVARVSSGFHLKLLFGIPPYGSKLQSSGFYDHYGGILLHKRSRGLKAKLDRVLLRAQQAGLYDKYVGDHLFRMWLNSTERDTGATVHALSMEEVFGALLVLAVGWTLSVVVFVSELLKKRISRSSK